ncbi:hypothetical protein QA612_02330 [Evansella sp. AB-P1]|uniref:CBO0543 family protein n=1 Tax=Evansella sp. AB-P1 TaxID=3037653 RepID=UPI00241FCDA8|nr:CBO0543 family protein [Evansella sp. AB-P1]MDG5786311.1 hypothetical protein [Evansella sp. AB-P1]
MANPSFDDIREVHQKLVELRLEYWINDNLFTFQWWLLLFLLIGPWIIWWKVVHKERISEVLLYGSILMVLVIILDDIGVELHLWSYPYQLFSLLPRLISIDQGIIIVLHMVLYQYFTKWKSFIISNTVMALIFAFICEPITVWLNVYQIDNWEYIYSFPIYIVKAILIKWLVDEIILKKQYENKKTL